MLYLHYIAVRFVFQFTVVLFCIKLCHAMNPVKVFFLFTVCVFMALLDPWTIFPCLLLPLTNVLPPHPWPGGPLAGSASNWWSGPNWMWRTWWLLIGDLSGGYCRMFKICLMNVCNFPNVLYKFNVHLGIGQHNSRVVYAFDHSI